MTQPGQGEDAGQLDVQVVADLRGFVKDLRTKVNAAAEKVKAKIGVQVKTTGLRTELRKAVKEAAAKSKVVASVGVKVTATELRRAVKEAAEKARAKVKIAVAVSATQLRRSVNEAAEKARPKIRVDADTKPARRAIDGLKSTRVNINVHTGSLTRSLRKAVSAAASLGGALIKGLGLAVVSAGAAAAATNVLGFAAAAATAAQSAGLLPAAVGAGIGILAALKLALSGVGDAISETFGAYSKLAAGGTLTAAEQEKLNEALSKLSPSARAFVLELAKVAPALNNLRLGVQEKFFVGLAGAVGSLATRYLPSLRDGLGEIASQVSGGLYGALSRLDTEANRISLVTLLFNSAGAAGHLSGALGPIVEMLLRIAEVGSNFLPGLASGLAEAADSAASFINAAADDGRLQEFISAGLSMLGDLARMGQDVIGILRGVFAAANEATGGGAFTLVKQVLDTLNTAANSVQGQQALVAVFTALAQVGSALSPVLSAVVGGLGPLASIVGDLAVALSPGLTVLVSALAEGLRLLAPAATPVGRALSDVARAVAPLLPLLGAQLANGLTLVAGILSVVARQAGPLLGVWARMGVQLATTLLPILQQLIAGGLEPAAMAGLALARAVMPLVPVIVQLARVIAAQLMANLPALQQMFTGQLVPAVTKIATALGGALLDALLALAPQLPDLVDAGIQLALAMTQLLVSVVPLLPYMVRIGVVGVQLLIWLLKLAPVLAWAAGLFTGLVGAVLGIPGVLGRAAAAVGGFFASAWALIQSVGTSIGQFFTVTLPGWLLAVGGWFAALPGRILAALVALPGLLGSLFLTALNQAAYWVGFGVASIIRYFLELPERTAAAIGQLVAVVAGGVAAVGSWFQQLPSRVSAIVSDLWARAGALFSAGVAAVVSYALQLPGRLSGAVDAAKARVTSAFSSMWAAARASVSSGVSDTASTIKGLPGRLGDLGSLLKGAGRQLIAGLVAGIKGATGQAVDAAKGVVGSAIRGAKDALGIKSPSRVFMRIGAQMVAGYTIGIDKSRPSAVQAAERLAGAVTTSAAAAGPVTPAPGRSGADEAAGLAPLIGSLTMQAVPGASVHDQIEELMFQLRVMRRGGVVAGTG
ncbi:hypothetical protein OOJ91_33835 [Micromonospora lupini]|uniref:phage tail protein n=1 Tax=Micromonospora lupini TaxID=285679 RepID=UPI0022538D03|nr:hypothetical protein [Micromonospora lupini]MCX5070829.1 hypothetical protein [Micromonospora lupini]